MHGHTGRLLNRFGTRRAGAGGSLNRQAILGARRAVRRTDRRSRESNPLTTICIQEEMRTAASAHLLELYSSI
jgi:hypothetical protein